MEESLDELDERKQKRAAAKARKGGTVQPVRDSSSDMGRGFGGAPSSPGRASYYTQNSGYNGYSPNYVNNTNQNTNSGYYTNNV